MFTVLLLNPPHIGSVRFNREGRCQQRVSSFGYLMVPMSLLYIATLLRDKGFEVKVIDCMAEKKFYADRLIDKIKAIAPKLIVISISTPTFSSDIKIVRFIKSMISTCISAIGIHGTILADETLLNSEIDTVVRGEPELTCLELAQSLAGGIGLKGVNGLSYKKDGRAYSNSDRQFIENLDELPFPDRSLIDIKKYHFPMNGELYTFIIPSRGCWHDCIFCQAKDYYGKKLRFRSVGNVIEEIEEVQAKFGIRNIAMLSDNFTLDKDFTIEVCRKLIRRNLRISWMANSRVDTVDYDILSLMKRAGCMGIAYGVESGDQSILDRIKKRITIGQIEKAFYWARRLGIKTLAQVIIGLPGETKATVEETLDLLIRIKPDFAQFNCAVPFPGTELHKLACDNKRLQNVDWDKYELNSAIISTDELSSQDIRDLRRKCYFKFYFRFDYMVKLLSNGKGAIKCMMLNGVNFFKEWVFGIDSL